MNKIYIFFGLFLLTSCGLSVEEKENIALNACSIMGETKKSDSLFRVQTIVEARETIGGEPFAGGDDAILEAFNFGLCKELVLNESYNESLQLLKDAIRERERIAAEKLAEEKRIADSKPTVKETFHYNGTLESRVNYQPKSDGGKEQGLAEYYFFSKPFGRLSSKGNHKDGKRVGTWKSYNEDGTDWKILNYKDGELHGLRIVTPQYGDTAKENYKDGKLDGLSEYSYKRTTFPYDAMLKKENYKDGKKDGLSETFYKNGGLDRKENYKDGELHGLRIVNYKSGELSKKENYKDGKEHGLHESYHKNGQLESKVDYKDGKEQRLYESYYDNGQLKYKINFKDGEREGLFEWYDSYGELLAKSCYRINANLKKSQITDMSYCEK